MYCGLSAASDVFLIFTIRRYQFLVCFFYLHYLVTTLKYSYSNFGGGNSPGSYPAFNACASNRGTFKTTDPCTMAPGVFVYVDFLTARGLSTWLLGSDTLTLVYCHRGCHRATKQIRDPRQLVHPPTCLVHVCYVYVDFLKTGGLRTWLLGFDTLTLVFCHSVTNYIAV